MRSLLRNKEGWESRLAALWGHSGIMRAGCLRLEGVVLAPRALNAEFPRLLKRAGFADKGYGLHTPRHTYIAIPYA